jgi:DNA-binding response OmpR family regulator
MGGVRSKQRFALREGVAMSADKPLVVIADDDELLQQLVSHKLLQQGYATRCVANGEDLLAVVAETVPHVIVLDAMMPIMDGFEALRRLRADPDTASVPVLMLTARRGEADVVRALELGASDYVSKPFLPEELALRVRQLIQRASAA